MIVLDTGPVKVVGQILLGDVAAVGMRIFVALAEAKLCSPAVMGVLQMVGNVVDIFAWMSARALS